jgi:hypothetical protein
MRDRRGHPETTREVLDLLPKHSAEAQIHGFSLSERTLPTKCDFRAAALNWTLRRHRGASREPRFVAAESCLTVIGAVEVVVILRVGRLALTGAVSPMSLHSVAVAAESVLVRANAPAHRLLAQLTAGQTREGLWPAWRIAGKILVQAALPRASSGTQVWTPEEDPQVISS